MKRILTACLILAAMPAFAQTANYGPKGWTATATGAATFPFGGNPYVPSPQAFVAFPSSVATINITATASGTSTTWTAQIEQASASTGPWTVCGSAVTITANATNTGTCTPSGSSFLEVVVTVGSGGGTLTGSLLGYPAGGGGGGGNLSGTLTSGYYPLATGTNTLGNGTIDYNVTTPDQVTLDSTQDASTTFYSVSSGKTDMVAASGGTAELVLGDPVNGTSLTDTSTHGLELNSASFNLISSGGTEINDNSSSGITIYEEGPSASGSYITLYTSSGPILLETGTTFQLLVTTAGNAIDFGITTPNVLTLVAPVLTNGATATTQPAGDSSTKIATTAFVISQGTISAGPGLFGASALNTVIAGTKASQAGHFTNLQVIASLGGTCTTPPQFNVFDGTSNVGTAVTATATTQTKGNATVQAQTRTFAAGDQIGIYISTAGATCTTDSFVVTAQYSTP